MTLTTVHWQLKDKIMNMQKVLEPKHEKRHREEKAEVERIALNHTLNEYHTEKMR